MNSLTFRTLVWSAAVLCSAMLLLVWATDERGMFGQTSAAWVQAIGSIGAIVGAAFLASQQVAHAREAERERRAHERQEREEHFRSMRAAAYDSIGVAKNHLENLRSMINMEGRLRDFDPLQFLPLLEGVQALLVHYAGREHAQPGTVLAVVATISDLALVVQSLREYDGSTGRLSNVHKRVRSALSSIDGTLYEMRDGQL